MSRLLRFFIWALVVLNAALATTGLGIAGRYWPCAVTFTTMVVAVWPMCRALVDGMNHGWGKP